MFSGPRRVEDDPQAYKMVRAPRRFVLRFYGIAIAGLAGMNAISALGILGAWPDYDLPLDFLEAGAAVPAGELRAALTGVFGILAVGGYCTALCLKNGLYAARRTAEDARCVYVDGERIEIAAEYPDIGAALAALHGEAAEYEASRKLADADIAARRALLEQAADRGIAKAQQVLGDQEDADADARAAS